MNPVFWILVLIAVVLLWFLMSFSFKGIGAVGLRLWNDAKNEISDTDADEKENGLKKENGYEG